MLPYLACQTFRSWPPAINGFGRNIPFPMVGEEKYRAAHVEIMKRQLLDILACPVCHHCPLELRAEKEDEKGVETGILTCPCCHVDYFIIDGIPDLMPPEQE